MTLKSFFKLNAFIGFFFGTVLLISPALLLQLANISSGNGTYLTAHLLGIELIGTNILLWRMGNSTDPIIVYTAVQARLVIENLSFLIVLLAKVEGLGNHLLSAIAVIYLLSSLGYAYFYFTLKKIL